MTHITIYKSTNGGIVGFRSAGDTTQVLLNALELGLSSVAAGNPDYLLITVKEV